MNLKSRWRHHLKQTENFLSEWNPQAQEILLIGTSGGYSIPASFLRRFKKVTAIEPDWLSRKIFEFRQQTHQLPHFSWLTKPFDFNAVHDGSFSIAPRSAILFCNLLGQINFNEEEGLLALETLETLSKSHELASYHDVLSGNDFRFEWESPMNGDEPLREKIDMEAFDPYFTPTDENALKLDLHVHPAAFLFEDTSFKYQYWEWQITGNQTQVIEAIYSR